MHLKDVTFLHDAVIKQSSKRETTQLSCCQCLLLMKSQTPTIYITMFIVRKSKHNYLDFKKRTFLWFLELFVAM